MARTGVPSRWDPCRRCGDVYRQTDMVPSEDLPNQWKMGWVCQPCAGVIRSRAEGKRAV